MIFPQIDFRAAQSAFARDGRCRVDPFLAPEIADRLYKTLSTETEFDVAYACSPSPQLVSAESWRQMDSGDRRSLQNQLMGEAAEGRGFLYCTYMQRNRISATTGSPEFLDEIFSFWSGDRMCHAVSEVTGIEVQGAECQFTRFTNGQYLTRHRDTLAGNRRRLAFVLSLSQGWHPDWGGLLHFYEETGDVSEVWIPRFSALQLFDINHIHSVSAVAPCAPRGRYSLTGWFTS